MTTLSDSYKLAFLSNIIKNKIVGNGSIPKKINTTVDVVKNEHGDNLMKKIHEVFKNPDENLYLRQENTVLPITISLKKKYLQHNDIIFNRISYMRLVTICNFFLQNNTVYNVTMPCLHDVHDVEVAEMDFLMQQVRNVSLSGNQDVVKAVEKMNSNVENQLTKVGATVELEITGLKTELSNIKKEVKDEQSELKKEAKDIVELLQQLVEKNNPLPIKNQQKATPMKQPKEKQSESRAPKSVFGDRQINKIIKNGNQYIVTFAKETKPFIVTENQLQKEDKEKIKEVQQKNKTINSTTQPIIPVKSSFSDYSDDFEPAGVEVDKTKSDTENTDARRSPSKTIKRKTAPPTERRGERDPNSNSGTSTLTPTRLLFGTNSNDDASYSDNFETESIYEENEFLKVFFNELGMKGSCIVTDAGIKYLYNGLKINKALYKKNYSLFFQRWRFEDIGVEEKDKAIIKDLFANCHEIDFDHDYLCLVGKELKLKWISYVRLAMYEKYIMINFFTNFEEYDIIDCVIEAMRNFIYDYCYLSTLMFENADQ